MDAIEKLGEKVVAGMESDFALYMYHSFAGTVPVVEKMSLYDFREIKGDSHPDDGVGLFGPHECTMGVMTTWGSGSNERTTWDYGVVLKGCCNDKENNQ